MGLQRKVAICSVLLLCVVACSFLTVDVKSDTPVYTVSGNMVDNGTGLTPEGYEISFYDQTTGELKGSGVVSGTAYSVEVPAGTYMVGVRHDGFEVVTAYFCEVSDGNVVRNLDLVEGMKTDGFQIIDGMKYLIEGESATLVSVGPLIGSAGAEFTVPASINVGGTDYKVTKIGNGVSKGDAQTILANNFFNFPAEKNNPAAGVPFGNVKFVIESESVVVSDKAFLITKGKIGNTSPVFAQGSSVELVFSGDVVSFGKWSVESLPDLTITMDNDIGSTDFGNFTFNKSVMEEFVFHGDSAQLGKNVFALTGIKDVYLGSTIVSVTGEVTDVSAIFSGCTAVNVHYSSDDALNAWKAVFDGKADIFTYISDNDPDIPEIPPGLEMEFDIPATVGGFKYLLSETYYEGINYYAARLISFGVITDGEEIIVPDFITYDNKTYDVVSIGCGKFGADYNIIENEYNPGKSLPTFNVVINGPVTIEDYAFNFIYSYEVELGGFQSTKNETIPLPLTAIELKGNGFRIGNASLSNTSISEINLDGVISIGDSAFSSTALENVVIPDDLVSMGNSVFDRCTNLKSVHLGNISGVPNGTFQGCTSLESVSGSFESIGTNAFKGSGIESFSSNTVKSIGVGAFRDSTGLKNVDLPGLDVVADSAFNGCTSLTGFIGSPTVIGSYAFARTSITEMDLTKVTSIGDYAFNRSGIIEASLDSIQTIGAFSFVGSLEKVTFGSGLTGIGDNAFYGSLLTSIVIPGTPNIGSNAFARSISLEYAKTAVVSSRMFEGCSSLTSVDLTGSTDLGSNAFSGTGLKQVTIPNTVSRMQSSVFLNCTSLESVVFENDMEVIPSGTFSGCHSLVRVELPDNLQTIGSNAFFGCSDFILRNTVLDLTIEDVMGWGYNAFTDSGSTVSETVSGSEGTRLTYLEVCLGTDSENEVFRFMIGSDGAATAPTDKYYELPENLAGIYSQALIAGIPKVTISSDNGYYKTHDGVLYSKDGKTLYRAPANQDFVDILDTTEVIAENAFRYTPIISISIPSSVKVIAENAFQTDTLESLELKEGLVTIANRAFLDTNLKEVNIPDSVEEIGDSAFYTKSKVFVIMGENSELKSVGTLAFSNVHDLYIPSSVETMGKNVVRHSIDRLFLSSVSVLSSNAFEGMTVPIYLPVDASSEYDIGDTISAGGLVGSTLAGYFVFVDGAPTVVETYVEAGDQRIYLVSGIDGTPSLNLESFEGGTATVTIVVPGGYTAADISVHLEGSESILMAVNTSNADVPKYQFEVSRSVVLRVDEAPYGDTFQVSFDTNGGSTVSPILVGSGRTIIESLRPDDPTRNKSEFLGWYTSDGEQFQWWMPIVSDLSLYAKWESADPMLIFETGIGQITATLQNGDEIKSGYRISPTDAVTFTYAYPAGTEFVNWTVTNPSGTEIVESPILTLENVSDDTVVDVNYRFYSLSDRPQDITYSDVPEFGETLGIKWKAGHGIDDPSSMTWTGHASSPLIVDDYVYIRVHENIEKIDIETGERVKLAKVSLNQTDYYHTLGYAYGYIFDYATSTVLDLDLNVVTTLPYGSSLKAVFMTDYGILTYHSPESTFTMYDEDLKKLYDIHVPRGVFGQFGQLSNVVVDGEWVYYLHVNKTTLDKYTIGLSALNISGGDPQYRTNDIGYQDALLDDGWLSLYDGKLYLPIYYQGLFDSPKPELPNSKLLTIDPETLAVTYEFEFEHQMGLSGLVVFNGRGYINSGLELYVIDMDTMTTIYRERSEFSHGGIVLNVNDPDNVLIYLLPYRSGSDLFVFSDSPGQTVGTHKVYDLGIPQYNTQAVRVGPNGELIWKNDTGLVFCVDVPGNLFSFVEVTGDSEPESLRIHSGEGFTIEGAMRNAFPALQDPSLKYDVYAYDGTVGQFTKVVDWSIETSDRVFMILERSGIDVGSISIDSVWYSKDDGSSRDLKTIVNDAQELRESGMISHYANPVHRVSYDLNGGTIMGANPVDRFFFAGEQVTVTFEVPVRDGYTFVGWMVTASSAGVFKDVGASLRFSTPAEGVNIIIVAKWKLAEGISATGVSLESEDGVVFLEGDQTVIQPPKYEILPENATDGAVRWFTSDPQVATVGNDGTIILHTFGEVTIAVMTSDGGFIDTVTLDVRKHVGQIGLEADSEVAFVDGEPIRLTVTTDGTENDVTWSSSDNDIAVVEIRDGVPYAVFKSAGEVTITAFSDDSDILSDSVTFTILESPFPDFRTMEVGTKEKLPDYAGMAKGLKAEFESSNPSILAIEDGSFVAKGVGISEVGVTILCNGVSLCEGQIYVTVTEKGYTPVGILAISSESMVLRHGVEDNGGTISAFVGDNDSQSYGRLIWMSSNESVVEVTKGDSGDATLVPKMPGEAIITVTIDGLVQTCRVVVVEITAEDITLYDGKKSADIEVITTPDTGDIKGMEMSFTATTGKDSGLDIDGKNVSFVSVPSEQVEVTLDVIIGLEGNEFSFEQKIQVKYVMKYTPVEIGVPFGSITMSGVGKTVSFTPEVNEGNSENVGVSEIQWRSDNESIAVVDSDRAGKVTVKSTGVGTTAIHGIAGGTTVSIKVTVNPGSEEEVEINRSTLSLDVGSSAMLREVNGLNVVWTTSDDSVLTVASDGTVTALEPGKAIVTATYGKLTSTCEVTVRGIVEDAGNLDVTLSGKPVRLSPEVYPEGSQLVWASSNGDVVKVDGDGNLSAVSPGRATVTCTLGSYSVTYNVTVESIPVTSVTIRSSASCDVGGTVRLTATVNPSNATDVKLTWSSSNPAVAFVSQDGTVSGREAGTVTITVTASNGIQATCILTVNPVKTVIELNGSVTLDVGKTYTAVAKVTPAEMVSKGLTWTSTDPSVATVSGSGASAVITAVAPGTTVVTVVASDGTSETMRVQVKAMYTTISIDRYEASVDVGGTITLTATSVPSGAKIQWSTSDGSVATVSNGKVTGVAPGIAVITAKVQGYDDLYETCTVVVKGAPQAEEPEIEDNGDGTKTVTEVTKTDIGSGMTMTSTVVKNVDADGKTTDTVTTMEIESGGRITSTVTIEKGGDGTVSSTSVTGMPPTEAEVVRNALTAGVSSDDVSEAVRQLAAAGALADTKVDSTLEINASIGNDSLTSAEMTIPRDALARIPSKNTPDVRINTDLGSVTMDGGVISTLTKGDGDASIGIRVVSEVALNDAQKATAAGAKVFDIYALVSGNAIHELGGTMFITIGHQLEEGESADRLAVYYLKDDGTTEILECSYDSDTNTVGFSTDHLSYYYVGYAPEESKTPSGVSGDGSGDSAVMVAIGVAIVILLAAILAVMVRNVLAGRNRTE